MADGNDCPDCDRSIGIWAVFKATMPNRIYCPHCKARLRYGGTGLLIALAIAATVILLAASFAFGAAMREAGDPVEETLRAVGFGVGFFIAGLVLLEVAFTCTLWYGQYRLERFGRPAFDPYEEF